MVVENNLAKAKVKNHSNVRSLCCTPTSKQYPYQVVDSFTVSNILPGQDVKSDAYNYTFKDSFFGISGYY